MNNPQSDAGLFDLGEKYSDETDFSAGSPLDSRTLINMQAEAHVRLSEDPSDAERADLRRMIALIDELAAECGDEWQYGISFIPVAEWEDYAREYARDTGVLNDDNVSWPYEFIDWPRAAAALAQDFTQTAIDGVDYRYRR